LLLANLEHDTEEKNHRARDHLGIDWPDDRKFDTYLPWLPLKCGGGIFVLIDNIFIITTDSSIAAAWQKRILANANLYNAEIKKGEVKVVPLSAEFPDNHSDFSGVVFSWNHRWARDVVDANPSLQQHLDAGTSPLQWEGTFRELASIVGQCLWIFRVGLVTLFDHLDYRTIARASFPAPDQDWNSPTSITGEPLKALFRMYSSCRSRILYPHATALRECKSVGYLATDAAYAQQIATLGFCYSINPQATPTKCGMISRVGPSQIAIEELRAVLLALKHMREHLGESFPDLIMLGIDSTHAKGIIANGIARTDEAVDILKSIHDTLGASRLYLSHVPSALNPADALTRVDVDWSDEKWYTLVDRLVHVSPMAVVSMKSYGSQIADRIGPRRARPEPFLPLAFPLPSQ
jgi:hypothetical protein